MSASASSSAPFAIVTETAIAITEPRPKSTPRRVARASASVPCPAPSSGAISTMATPRMTSPTPSHCSQNSDSPRKTTAMAMVATCPSSMSCTTECDDSSRNALKNSVSATPIPSTPLRKSMVAVVQLGLAGPTMRISPPSTPNPNTPLAKASAMAGNRSAKGFSSSAPTAQVAAEPSAARIPISSRAMGAPQRSGHSESSQDSM